MDKEKYFITSERLGFAKWKSAYFSFAKRLWGNIEVTRLIDLRGELNDTQIKEKLDLEILNEKEYGVQYYPIFLRIEDEFIGCCGLRPYDVKKTDF